MNRLDKKFRQLKKDNKKAFIAFVTAGFPSLNITEKLIYGFSEIGVDCLELGVPFSDPLADGPVIQEASQKALEKGVNLKDILNLVKRARKHTDMPICLMTYYNPIFCFGEGEFVKEAKEAGVDGIVIPDLPPEEGRNLIALSNKSGLDVICFIAPTTSKERMKYISGISKGFIYYVSLTGVTGARKSLPEGLINNLKAIKRITRKPVCVGFGVSTNEQVRQIYKVADGVIVGSAIVKKIRENKGKKDLIETICKFVSGIKNV